MYFVHKNIYPYVFKTKSVLEIFLNVRKKIVLCLFREFQQDYFSLSLFIRYDLFLRLFYSFNNIDLC